MKTLTRLTILALLLLLVATSACRVKRSITSTVDSSVSINTVTEHMDTTIHVAGKHMDTSISASLLPADSAAKPLVVKKSGVKVTISNNGAGKVNLKVDTDPDSVEAKVYKTVETKTLTTVRTDKSTKTQTPLLLVIGAYIIIIALMIIMAFKYFKL